MFKNLKNPTVYAYKDSFITALKARLANPLLEVSVEWIKFEDTRANVLINNEMVGTIVSYYEDKKIPDNILLYFIPNISFFKFVNSEDVTTFINLSNKFMKSYVEVVTLIGDVKVVEKSFDDFNLDVSEKKNRIFPGIFLNSEFNFNETSRFIFSLVADNESFKLIDDFKMTIKNRGMTMFSILGIQEQSLFEANKMFSVSFEKNDDIYQLKQNYSKPVHFVDFKITDDVPNMVDFISIVFHYSIMETKKIDLPLFEDFINKKDEYSEIIEMHLI